MPAHAPLPPKRPPYDACSRTPPSAAQAPASEGAYGDQQRNGSSGSSSGGVGGSEPSRIVNFFRSIFGLGTSPRDGPAAAVDVTVNGVSARRGEGAAPGATVSGERGGGASGGARAAAAEAAARFTPSERFLAAVERRDAAEEALNAARERLQAAAEAAAAGGVGGVVGVNIPAPVDVGGDGTSFALRDLLSFLQPAFVGPDPAGSIVSLEQALTWPLGNMGMMAAGVGGVGPGGSAGPGSAGMVQRRLQRPTADEARQELQFNGLMLAPHQVSQR